MRKSRFLLSCGIMLAFSSGLNANNSERVFGTVENPVREKTEIASSFNKINQVVEESQVRMSALRANSNIPDSRDVVFLDSVISNERKEYYQYNDHGWLISRKYYVLNNGEFELDTEDSYTMEYQFDSKDRITQYSQYLYNADGTKGAEISKAVYNWKGDREHSELYYIDLEYVGYEEYEGVKGLQLMEEIGYDKFGNPTLYKEYDWNSEKGSMELTDMVIMQFTGCAIYWEEDDGFYELELDEELFEKYCNYYLEMYENEIYGNKIDEKTEGLTTTRTLYELYVEDDTVDISNIDNYWEFIEESVITLTPSRNRYASIYYYEAPYEEDYPSYEPDYGDMPEGVETRAADNVEKVLDSYYIFEWDEYERLIKRISQGDDDEDWERTFTYIYVNDKANKITLQEFEEAMEEHWEGCGGKNCSFEGSFYGTLSKERVDVNVGYAERIYDQYDENGNVLHIKTTEVFYSEEELGYDTDGDNELSSERYEDTYEVWYTYSAGGKLLTEINTIDNGDFEKYEYINEQKDGKYYIGEILYHGTSKDGPWQFNSENVEIFNSDPSTDPDIVSVGGWWKRYDAESQEWFGFMWENYNGYYVEYSIDPVTGEFNNSGTRAATRAETLEKGDHEFFFVDGNWQYYGFKRVDYVYDELTGTENLEIIDGIIEISWVGSRNGKYKPSNPATNYIFPYGPQFWGIEECVGESMSPYIRDITVWWDPENKQWFQSHDVVETEHYYTNDNGQIVNEEACYLFNVETERMEADYLERTIYSFDDMERLAKIENPEFTTNYVYRDNTSNYLLESYNVNNESGVKYDVCRYYYSDGKYIYPYTEVEKIENKAEWSLEGTTITAIGQIVVYNIGGAKVADGFGTVTVPAPGLYIMEVNGRTTKLLVK